MNTMTQNTHDTRSDTRKVVSQADFDKEIDKEYAYLTWIDRMESNEARKEAQKRVSKEFVIRRTT